MSNKWKSILAAVGVMAVLALLLVAGLYLKPEAPVLGVAGVSNFDSVTLSKNLVVDGTADLNSTLAVDGNITLGDAIGDNVYVYGQMRSYDGSDNWADVSDVSALSRNSGWHTSYNVTGWGGETDFQAFFANTQVATTSANCSIYGAETKATLKGIAASGTTTGYGLMGKVIAKTTAYLPYGYGVYSRLETDGAADSINAGANFMADLDNTGTITTSVVLDTSADTWTYGVDFNDATFGTADIRLMNGESIDNLTNGTVGIEGNVAVTGTLASSGAATLASASVTGVGTVGTFLGWGEATAVSVTAGSTITPAGSYQPITCSEVGPVTTSTTTAIADGGAVGYMLILVNENVTQTITIDDGGNTLLSGDAVLGAGDTLWMIWDGADWVEIAQANNT